jgi:hypothetical protein
MAYPTKEDIEDAIKDLEIHVNACSPSASLETTKLIGGQIARSMDLGHISNHEATGLHEETNKLIRRFRDKCSCTIKM